MSIYENYLQSLVEQADVSKRERDAGIYVLAYNELNAWLQSHIERGGIYEHIASRTIDEYAVYVARNEVKLSTTDLEKYNELIPDTTLAAIGAKSGVSRMSIVRHINNAIRESLRGTRANRMQDELAVDKLHKEYSMKVRYNQDARNVLSLDKPLSNSDGDTIALGDTIAANIPGIDATLSSKYLLQALDALAASSTDTVQSIYALLAGNADKDTIYRLISIYPHRNMKAYKNHVQLLRYALVEYCVLLELYIIMHNLRHTYAGRDVYAEGMDMLDDADSTLLAAYRKYMKVQERSNQYDIDTAINSVLEVAAAEHKRIKRNRRIVGAIKEIRLTAEQYRKLDYRKYEQLANMLGESNWIKRYKPAWGLVDSDTPTKSITQISAELKS